MLKRVESLKVHSRFFYNSNAKIMEQVTGRRLSTNQRKRLNNREDGVKNERNLLLSSYVCVRVAKDFQVHIAEKYENGGQNIRKPCGIAILRCLEGCFFQSCGTETSKIDSTGRSVFILLEFFVRTVEKYKKILCVEPPTALRDVG